MKRVVAEDRLLPKLRSLGSVALVLLCAAAAHPRLSAQRQSRGVPVDWQQMLPTIRQTVDTPEFREDSPRPFEPVIERAAMLKDGVSVALVNLGSGYDPARSRLVVFVGDHGQPVPATFDFGHHEVVRGGQVFPKTVAPDQREWMEVDTRDNAVLAKFFLMNADGAGLATCQVDAYRWDMRKVMFRRDRRLSKSLTRPVCRGIAEQYINPEQRHERIQPQSMSADETLPERTGGWMHKLLPWNWRRRRLR